MIFLRNILPGAYYIYIKFQQNIIGLNGEIGMKSVKFFLKMNIFLILGNKSGWDVAIFFYIQSYDACNMYTKNHCKILTRKGKKQVKTVINC